MDIDGSPVSVRRFAEIVTAQKMRADPYTVHLVSPDEPLSA